MRADTIYKNGRFYTENRTVLWAEAVAIEGRNLIAVGTESDCAAFADEKTRIQDFTDHACWMNSAALELLKDEKGEIHIETDAVEPNFKKDDNGEYTGWVQEPFDAIDEVIYEKLDWYPPQEITDEMVDPLLDYPKFQEGIRRGAYPMQHDQILHRRDQ